MEEMIFEVVGEGVEGNIGAVDCLAENGNKVFPGKVVNKRVRQKVSAVIPIEKLCFYTRAKAYQNQYNQ